MVHRTRFEELGAPYDALFAAAGRTSLFASALWYRSLAACTIGADQAVHLYGLEDDSGRPRILLAANAVSGATPFNARALAALANQYTVHWDPVVAPDEDDLDALLRPILGAVAAQRPRWDMLQFRSLDPRSPLFVALRAGLEAAGFAVHAYFQYGNWREPLNGRSFEAYLRDRGSSIRRTLPKKARRLDRSERARFRLVSNDDDLDTAIADYLKVYAASWKGEETHPDFIPTLIGEAARAGILRLGLLYVDGEPAATQLAFLSGDGIAMYKAAYDERFAADAAGGIVVLKVLEHVIDVDGVAEIDFGIGDEPYKQEWMSERQERWGILALNRRSARGRLIALREMAGALKKRASAWSRARPSQAA